MQLSKINYRELIVNEEFAKLFVILLLRGKSLSCLSHFGLGLGLEKMF